MAAVMAVMAVVVVVAVKDRHDGRHGFKSSGSFAAIMANIRRAIIDIETRALPSPYG
jgi:hypothetical protein